MIPIAAQHDMKPTALSGVCIGGHTPIKLNLVAKALSHSQAVAYACRWAAHIMVSWLGIYK
jgi:hypothetical protein